MMAALVALLLIFAVYIAGLLLGGLVWGVVIYLAACMFGLAFPFMTAWFTGVVIVLIVSACRRRA